MTGGWILGFDTATRATAVALVHPESDPIEARDDQPPGRRPEHAAALLPLCAQVLDAAGIAFTDLARIAVGIGPGTFTGLRIGVATARALGRASGVPLVPVSTLQSVAWGALGQGDGAPGEAVLAVLDARRHEAFVAGWRAAALQSRHPPLIEPQAVGPAALADQAARLGARPLAIGEGAVEFREVLERSGAFVPDDGSPLHRVSAVNHCRIGRDLEPVDPGQILPQYLRLPDAELARRAAGKR